MIDAIPPEGPVADGAVDVYGPVREAAKALKLVKGYTNQDADSLYWRRKILLDFFREAPRIPRDSRTPYWEPCLDLYDAFLANHRNVMILNMQPCREVIRRAVGHADWIYNAKDADYLLKAAEELEEARKTARDILIASIPVAHAAAITDDMIRATRALEAAIGSGVDVDGTQARLFRALETGSELPPDVAAAKTRLDHAIANLPTLAPETNAAKTACERAISAITAIPTDELCDVLIVNLGRVYRLGPEVPNRQEQIDTALDVIIGNESLRRRLGSVDDIARLLTEYDQAVVDLPTKQDAKTVAEREKNGADQLVARLHEEKGRLETNVERAQSQFDSATANLARLQGTRSRDI